MTIPASAAVQFDPGSGTLYVDSLLDPSGNPTSVLDIDEGFTINGHLDLPGWLSGIGNISLVADQHGGPIDQVIGVDPVAVTGATLPTDPPTVTYPWSINVISPTLPDATAMYQLGIIFAFQTPGGGHTDIGGFYDLGSYLVV